MAIIQEISELLQKGKAKAVKELVAQALEEGLDPKEILNEGLLSGMMIIGAKFKNNEVFVPEVLVAARAMNHRLGAEAGRDRQQARWQGRYRYREGRLTRYRQESGRHDA